MPERNELRSEPAGSFGLEVAPGVHVTFEADIGMQYYTPEVHRAAFTLPQFLRNIVAAATRPEEEEEVRSFPPQG